MEAAAATNKRSGHAETMARALYQTIHSAMDLDATVRAEQRC